MKDVLCARGEAVGHPSKGAREPRDGSRVAGERSMQMGDSSLAHLPREHDRLIHVTDFQAARFPEPGPQGRQDLGGGLDRRPEVAGAHVFLGRQIVDRRSHARDRILEMGVAGRPQRKDIDLEARSLVSEDLAHDERFGVARIPFDHVAHAQRLIRRHAEGLLRALRSPQCGSRRRAPPPAGEGDARDRPDRSGPAGAAESPSAARAIR